MYKDSIYSTMYSKNVTSNNKGPIKEWKKKTWFNYIKEENKQVCLCIVIRRLERHQTLVNSLKVKRLTVTSSFFFTMLCILTCIKEKKREGRKILKESIYSLYVLYTHILQYTPKNWCFWTVVLEKTLESPFDSKEIQPVHPTGNQSWIFIGRLAPILWPPDAKNWLTGKDPNAGKDWRRENGMTEVEMVGWHHQLSGHESE